MLRWSMFAIILVPLVALCGLVFAVDGTWVNLVKAVGWALAAFALVWGVIVIANHFKLTGTCFRLGKWLDAISDAQPDESVGPNADRIGMAIVVASLVLGALVLAGLFINI